MSVRRRAWMETCLRYLNKIPKKSIGDFFGVSPAQISADLRELRDELNAAAGDVEISAGQIVGRLPRDPVKREEMARIGFGEVVRSGAFGRFKSIDSEIRTEADEEILGKIMAAILGEQVIEISYTSMTSGSSTKIISPHHIVETGGRMHCRAYDHDKRIFSDFVLNRVDSFNRVVAEQKAQPSIEDRDFRDPYDLWLEANPRLDAERRAAVCREYGLGENGKRRIVTTRASEIYIRALLGQTRPDHIPPVIVARRE